ncbi:duboraya isoform X2 [Anarrhichthys ocellatus]|uniref:duboraya isoform X2 n=1 Tax=Anarrhichthys ocellatus TaxID=433405 RepID=UPI0012ECBF43|nr:capZ-interacting protein-like isoform X2 [Anarrhichthys ocellatus]
MEEEAPSRRSVAELAGRFKGSSRPHDAAGNETEKPVRRRPPRSLQLPKTTGDDQEQPPGVTSPLPAKAKRNSALIEKLQANLALSPMTLLPSPKSPGFKLLPPAFIPPSPSSAPVFGFFSSTPPPPASPLNTTSPWTEEEGPASFEAPPTVEEGSILSNTSIKGRARHSIRRRPPSRRHRTSSSGDEVGVAIEGEEATEAEDKSTTTTTTTTTTGGETDEGKEDKTDKSHEQDESEINDETRGDEEKKKERSKGEGSSSGRKEEEEEKNSEEKQTEDSTEGKTNTKSTDEEKKEETTSQSPAR